MKKIEQIIKRLEEKGFSLSCADDSLYVAGKTENKRLSAEDREIVKKHKQDIINYLIDFQNCSINVIDRNKQIPLSFAQQRLWFLDRYQGGNSNNYNIPIVFRIKGELKIKVLEDSINILIERHEAFRTVFKIDETGAGYQEIKDFGKTLQVNLEPYLLSEQELDEKLKKEGLRNFDLSKDQLIRVRLFRLHKTEHIICFTQHHIISDAWSVSIFLKELSQVYNSISAGKKPDLPGLDIQYADFSVWQRSYLTGTKLERQIDFWKNSLSGFERLQLPTDKPRPLRQTFNGASLNFSIPAELINKLRTLSEETDSTLYIILLSAFYILLRYYSRQDDIVVGTPIANRHFSRIENLIGFFVNTLVLRANTKGHSVVTLIKAVRDNCLAAYEHQDLPFEKLTEEPGVERDQSYSPIFQVMFVLQNASDGQEFMLNGLETEPVDIDYGISKFDLTLAMIESPSGLKGILEYNTDLFNRSTAERMIFHYRNVLLDMVNYPDKPVNGISLLSHREYDQIVYGWNDTRSSYPFDKTISQLFEEQVEKTPDNIALTFKNIRLTYRELNTRANKLAHTIRTEYKEHWGEEITSDAPIGIYIDRSPEMIIGVLGILKSGAAYIPFDLADPEKRLRFKINDSKCRMILSSQMCIPDLIFLADKDTLPLAVDSYWDEIDKASDKNPGKIKKPEDLAYVIYTSGSTGHPKGVMIEHRSFINYYSWFLNYSSITEKDVVDFSLSFCFDGAISTYLVPLLTGAEVVICPKEVFQDPDRYTSYLKENQITILKTTPGYFNIFSRYTNFLQNDLRLIILGGEKLDESPVKEYFRNVPSTKIINEYGPTEATIGCTQNTLSANDETSVFNSIGQVAQNATIYILDTELKPVPVGVHGELYIGGDCLARGYSGNTALTAERFVPNPFVTKSEKTQGRNLRIYRSGDIARRLENGCIEYLGRNDDQVKIRGFRVEPGEIEAKILDYQSIEQAVVILIKKEGTEKLCAYYAGTEADKVKTKQLKEFLERNLPAYMVPSYLMKVDEFPLSANGKIDIRALPEPDTEVIIQGNYVPPVTELEKTLSEIWCKILKLDNVGVNNNFFDVGGESLSTIKVQVEINRRLDTDIKVVDLFTYPTIKSMAEYIAGNSLQKVAEELPAVMENTYSDYDDGIAIIGYSGAFSGCSDIEDYWEKISNGHDCISHLSRDECLKLGVPEDTVNKRDYVASTGLLDEVDEFDACFWGISPREAELMDPQIRHFLQHSWSALENSGYINRRENISIGIFAGAGNLSYFINNVIRGKDDNIFEANLLANKDFLVSKVAYYLNLNGPALNLNTACSTSLVAVTEACEKLSTGKCDLALAGGVTLQLPQDFGYIYRKGMISSPDGHCRVFDKNAKGLVSGSGVGCIVLKRLSDARRDGDNIIAIIKGYAVNNDGNRKVGYTAPSVQGQKECILEAQRRAAVTSDEISYVECHGSATELGDPVEVEALNQAFGANKNRNRECSCILGGVKANIGHVDTAAGIAGLIKICKMLQTKTIPPQIYYEGPNPLLNLEKTPFKIVTRKQEWKVKDGTSRKAGLSSFGIGGTNVHMILEEPLVSDLKHSPELSCNILTKIGFPKFNCYDSAQISEVVLPDINAPGYILSLSAKTEDALERAGKRLAEYLLSHPETTLSDIAYTLHTSRMEFNYRYSAVFKNKADALSGLQKTGSRNKNIIAKEEISPIVFLCSGVGEHYVNMGRELYEREPRFRELINDCCSLIGQYVGTDFLRILYPEADKGDTDRSSSQIKVMLSLGQKVDSTDLFSRTEFAHLSVFITGYAMAGLLESWGIKPDILIGHSVGEYLAACLAGVFSLEDALYLVFRRAGIIQTLPVGGMLAVPVKEKEIVSLIDRERLSVAAVNGPSLCVVSGEITEIDKFANDLLSKRIVSRKLPVSRGFHSIMMRDVEKQLFELFKSVEFRRPEIPYISNLTGKQISSNDIITPEYWVRHTCETVRFADGVQELLKQPNTLFVEIGPGSNLASAVLQHQTKTLNLRGRVMNTLRNVAVRDDDYAFLMNTLSRLWLNGVKIDWDTFYKGKGCSVKDIPVYSFEKTRYWLNAGHDFISSSPDEKKGTGEIKRLPVNEWFYEPCWEQTFMPDLKEDNKDKNFLIFSDTSGMGTILVEKIVKEGNKTRRVKIGNSYSYDETCESYMINPELKEDYMKLFSDLKEKGFVPDAIIYLWPFCNPGRGHNVTLDSVTYYRSAEYCSLLYIAQEVINNLSGSLKLIVVTNGVYSVYGTETLYPERALLQGIIKCFPQEYPEIKCKLIDVCDQNISRFSGTLVREILSDNTETQVALRNHKRWILTFKNKYVPSIKKPPALKNCGVYFLAGGLGNIGLLLAEYLAKTVKAKLILTTRSSFPDKAEWKDYPETHGSEDVLSRKIIRLQKIENSGGKVLVVKADVSSKIEMRNALAKARDVFGDPDGFVHLAGSVREDDVTDIQNMDNSHIDKQFLPKVNGLLVLEESVKDMRPDFCLLISSLSPILGGLYFGAYAAANSFMDTFVYYKWSAHGQSFWHTLNVDGWNFDNDSTSPDILPEEAERLFNGFFFCLPDSAQIVVSTHDIDKRIKKWVELKDDSITEKDMKQQNLYSRPDLVTDYTAPENEQERRLVEIWQSILGIDSIGVDDCFFELGGNSLTATYLVSKIRKEFNKTISVKTIFENRTIKELLSWNLKSSNENITRKRMVI